MQAGEQEKAVRVDFRLQATLVKPLSYRTRCELVNQIAEECLRHGVAAVVERWQMTLRRTDQSGSNRCQFNVSVC